VWLTISGYVFYGAWDYRFCALMAFSTCVSYLAGLGMLLWDANESRRRLCLVVPVVTDLALLGFFKYAGFTLESVRWLTTLAGHPLRVPTLNIILPIGISFYTFHTISYVVDSYRRVIVPTRKFWEFSCYVSLFCQLVAGPIVRFRQIEADLNNIERVDRRAYWNRGWSFFVMGLAKKVILADTIASVIDPALGHYRGLSTVSVWLVMIGYASQIYFDFSGYSDMAVGLGALFGLRIPQNFNSPYKATDPSSFWQRWHISLSTCMRDYVYIPLGGNRRSEYRNLVLTMLLAGAWHGANWTFIAWGAYHGALLITYRLARKRWDTLPESLRRAAMFIFVVVGWVFFRATSLSMAATILRHMFVPTDGVPVVGAGTLAAMVLFTIAIAMGTKNTFEIDHRWSPPMTAALASVFAVSLALIYSTNSSPFLYFQF